MSKVVVLLLALSSTSAVNFLELTCSCEVPSSCASVGFTSDVVDEETAIFLLGCEQISASDVNELRLSWLGGGINRTFEAFTNLATLKVSKSKIELLSAELFKDLLQLERIWMDGNEIEALPDFPGLEKLTKIFLANNKIEIIKEKNFKSMLALESINLESNDIFYIHSKAFASNKKLKHINLNRNDLSFLESETFDSNFDLKELTMNFNHLKRLPPRIFDRNKKLEVLRLHSNAIENLEKNIFAHTVNLRWIELSENRLVFVHQEVFSELKNLEFVNVAWNDCIDDSYPIEMTFEHFLKLINRNCHVFAALYFDLI